jgi:hypothetical protein
MENVMKKVNIPITDLEHEAILWSEQFNGYNREKSYIICESASSVNYNGIDRFDGTFVVHIYHKGTFHFTCGVDKRGDYGTMVVRIG